MRRDPNPEEEYFKGVRVPTPDVFIQAQPEDIPTLKHMALHDADPQRRLAAVTLLGASDDPDIIPVLAQALSDQDEDVRMAAIQSLADFTGEAPLEAIESALNDPSPDVRYEALEVLSDIGGERARRAVERVAQSDPDEDVRELAESILEFDLNDEQND
jgi:HEAT repeat protein